MRIDDHPLVAEVTSTGAPRTTATARPPAPPAVSSLMLDMLEWLARAPRSYGDAMEAWRSSCPRFTIWEDALGDGLIRVERGAGPAMNETRVALTPIGRAMLSDHRCAEPVAVS